MIITRVLHASVNVAGTLDDAIAFYREVLGLEVARRPRIAGVDGAWFDAGDVQLHLVGAPHRSSGIDTAAHHVCFAVADLDAAVAEITAAGMDHVEGSQVRGRRTVRQVWITDPAGNVVELQQDPAHAGYGAAGEPLDELASLGAATLGESGARRMHRRIAPAWPGAVVAGPAFPVRCTGGDNLAIHVAVTRAPEGAVLVADVGGVREFGYWGEVLTTAAEARGLAGLVIDGCVRDVRALEARRFPVFSTGLALTGATKNRRGSTHVPVAVGDVAVSPGDWVVGDGDGLVVVPADDLEAVLAAGRERAAAEVELFRKLREGATTVELLGLDDSLVEPTD